MKILLIGGGAREHALAWKIRQSSLCDELVCLGGNAGIAAVAESVPMAGDDVEGMVRFCQQFKPDLVVPGAEVPLVLGLVDRLQALNIPAFGPTAAAAQLEGSKGFTKDLCAAQGIPTAAFHRVKTVEDAKQLVQRLGVPLVLKADGLAAGKGVIIAHDLDTAMAAVDSLMQDHAELVLEALMQGPELSFFAIADGKNVVPMTSARDYKRAFDGDQGLNTGGMGVYSAVADATPVLEGVVMDRIIEPTMAGLRKQGIAFQGIFYAGLMLTEQGPKLIEYNVRFGDPEAQVLMPRLQDDLVDLMLASVHGQLNNRTLHWSPQAALGVVVSDREYPTGSAGSTEIRGLEALEADPDTLVFHAGTRRNPDGAVVNNGGRVLTVVRLGDTVASIRPQLMQDLTQHLGGNNQLRWRTDIGYHEVEA